MALVMRTSPPEVNKAGEKRWYIGDLDQHMKKVFLHESTCEQRQATGCKRFMVCTYTHHGECLTRQFFRYKRQVNMHLGRLFKVDQVELGEWSEPLKQAA